MPSITIRDGYGSQYRCDSSHPAVIAHFCEEWIRRFASADASIQPQIQVYPLYHEMTNPDGTLSQNYNHYEVSELDRERTRQLLDLFLSWQGGEDNPSQNTETPVREVPSQPRRRRQRPRDIPQESAEASEALASLRTRLASNA